MKHPLQGALLRLKWARQHFVQLQTEIAAWPAHLNVVMIDQEFDSDVNQITVKVVSVPSYPAEWSRLSSEAIFNLRAALDYTAWELANWNVQLSGGTVQLNERTQYPIATEPERFRWDQITSLHPNHQALIEWFQPYGKVGIDLRLDELQQQFDRAATLGLTPGLDHMPSLRDLVGSNPDFLQAARQSHPLAKLMAINDHDKHRTLKPVGMTGGRLSPGYEGVNCTVSGSGRSFVQGGGPFEVGMTWAIVDVVPTGPNPKVRVKDQIIPRIAFGGDDILSEFERIYGFVRTIVGTFWSVFT